MSIAGPRGPLRSSGLPGDPDPVSPRRNGATAAGASRRTPDAWLERWMATVADLAELKASHPMLDAVIDEQVGRKIRIGDHWLFDFASCNYLGFDLDPEIIAAVPEYLAKWGTHPSWSRLLGSPVIYEQIETKLTDLLGCEDTLLLPTITHIHMSVIPILAGGGVIFLDGRAHKTIYDGAMVARGHGATVVRFRHNDPAHLEELLRAVERDTTSHRDGRRQLDDRERARRTRVRRASPATTTRCSTSTTPTVSAWSANATRSNCATGARAATASSAITASPTTT